MSEKKEKTISAPTGQKIDTQPATMEIAYCPHLGIYYHRDAAGEEYFFNRIQLEVSLEEYLKQHNLRQADFMAKLTGYARQYPHVMVIIKTDGTYNLVRMEIPEDERKSK